jgi:hypothetical protein
MMSTSPLTAHQIVGCIATGRPPTAAEEDDLAARIWTETGRDRTRQMWSQLAPAAWDRLMAFRAARAALRGVAAPA